MNDEQQQLPLDEPSLTAWVTGAPPCVGWWNARKVNHPYASDELRRYWHGDGWSWPVGIGASDEDTVTAASHRSYLNTDEIEWRGLAHPRAS
jgi:hypothetical protein